MSNLCVYSECFHRLREDGRPNCLKKFAFTIVCVYNRLRVDGALVLLRAKQSGLNIRELKPIQRREGRDNATHLAYLMNKNKNFACKCAT